MIKPSLPDNEEQRLKALSAYQILDTPTEDLYDDITKIASQICQTPIALVSLIDDKRQWFKSHHGLNVSETEKDFAYCAHAINNPDEVFEIPDAFEDERFHDNPLATGFPNVRFYAGAPLKDSDGFALGTLCVIDHKARCLTDEQKESLMALSRQVVTLLQLRKENNSRKEIDKAFTDLLENLGDGVSELDSEGRCTYINPRMLELLNMDLDEIKSSTLWDVIHCQDVDAMKAFYAEQFRQKKTNCYYEFRLVPKGKKAIWIGQNTTMEYEGDRMVKLRAIARDLSENKALKKKLEIKESLFKLVSENSSDLIALHEPDATYKFVSGATKDLIGFEPPELLGKSPYSFIHPEDVERLKNGPHQSTLKGKSIEKVEYRMQKKDGSYIWLESYTKPIFDDNNEIISFQTSSRDISEKREEREQLKIAKIKAEEASEAKANFLSMMSHEIRTPLNGIIGATHLLLNKSPKENQLTHLNILKRSGDSLLAIVNDILDFSKIEEGKIALESAEFSLNEIAENIYKNYTLLACEKQVKVSLKYDPSLSKVYIGDSVRISQVLHNLMSNAVKFTEQGCVELSISKINQHDNFDEILFEVNDTGIGVSEDKRKDIFEGFIQAERSTTRKYGGSGLGLSITKKLLELMNSQINLVSYAGKGSKFDFSLILPRKKTGVSPKKSTHTSNEFEALSATILLVEDNTFNRTIAKDFLESWECTVKEAINGKEAMAILESETLDLVLLDLQMPIMDGFETIKAIRDKKDPYFKDLPVIALTAAAMDDNKDKVFKSGMNDYITKPFLPLEFYNKLSSQLNQRKPKTQDKKIVSFLLRSLEEKLGSENGKIAKYLGIFREIMIDENKILREAILEEDVGKLKAYAHKIKSNVKMVGLSDLAMEAEELEDMIDKKNPDSMILDRAKVHDISMQEILKQLQNNQ